MKKVKIITKSVLTLKGIRCFIKREVKPFGTSGRIDFPKEFIGQKVFVVVANE
jgi:putative transposon-encoded protein